ncbi:hypothetical protein [Pseudobutyrivibrio sp. AR14]|uniref:hypothetical protein n=1 Tax=Pseudobutyrivibrio sp. AR14 TaxID=1520804 RepID=UPI0011600172|nr:hypothetical protein [Pseudobutyrivibrio sp. AR14]
MNIIINNKESAGELGRLVLEDVANEGLNNNLSNIYRNTSVEVRNVIEQHGMTVDEFVEFLDSQRVLTNAEATLVKVVRDEIGLPPEGVSGIGVNENSVIDVDAYTVKDTVKAEWILLGGI